MARTLKKPTGIRAVQAAAIELPAQVSVGRGFRIIASNCLAQVRDNEAGVVEGGDPESVHQMRVGVRRLRSALRLFERWRPVSEQLRGELAWLADQLGDARDADVLASSTLPKVMQAGMQPEPLQPLLRAAAAIAGEKRQRVAEAVSSARYSELIGHLSGELRPTGPLDSSEGHARLILKAALKRRATKVLGMRHKKLIDLGRQLATGTVEERHRLRIMAKRARYATEFFRSLYSSKPAKRYIQGLIALQDELGTLNDAAVADRLLRELARSHPDLTSATEFTRGVLWGRSSQDARVLTKLWEKFSAIKPPF